MHCIATQLCELHHCAVCTARYGAQQECRYCQVYVELCKNPAPRPLAFSKLLLSTGGGLHNSCSGAC